MSNAIRYDSLLVRRLAAELSDRLRGRRLRRIRLDADRRRAALELDDAALTLELHPERGWIAFTASPADAVAAELRRRTAVRRVVAPTDERVLYVDLSAPRTEPVARVVVELMTNQWNVLALDRDGRIRHVLWSRTAGERVLRQGHRYQPPPPAGRVGAEVPLALRDWRARLEPIPPAERPARLVHEVAWTSPLNARPVLGEAAVSADAAALEAAHARYTALAFGADARPVLLRLGDARQPYPAPLPGVDAEPVASVLDGLARVADAAAPAAGAAATPQEAAAPALPPELLERAARRHARLRRRRERLRQEHAGAGPAAERLRHHADLLLSQPGDVPRGARQATLSDFQGGTVTVPLDPALDAVGNAQKLYDAARRRERAAERLPGLIAGAERALAELGALLERARTGRADAAELEAAAGPAPATTRPRATAAAPPYRRYRTSGGLEVRVGRGGEANDDLTFHHSAPDDIWLHARDAAGAHVILRWDDAAAGPPARDLTEAAVLAAVHSRARTSGTVAVDWTRRKYVRKPRKSPPGLVLPDRVKTLFVEPSEALERKLRAEG